jgi:hypothetical protein
LAEWNHHFFVWGKHSVYLCGANGGWISKTCRLLAEIRRWLISSPQ